MKTALPRLGRAEPVVVRAAGGELVSWLAGRCTAVVIAVMSVAHPCAGEPPSFRGLGPGLTATFVSDNGRVVTGTTPTPGHLWEAFRWTEAEGVRLLGVIENIPCNGSYWCTNNFPRNSLPGGISADGSVIVGGNGVYDAGSNYSFPFRWTEQAGIQLIPGTTGMNDAVSVTPDGTTIVGGGNPVSLWTEADGWEQVDIPLASPSVVGQGWPVCGVSSDSEVIAGIFINNGRTVAAARHNGNLVIVEPDGMENGSYCFAASANGLYVVGAGGFDSRWRAFRAIVGQVGVILDTPTGGESSCFSVANDSTTAGVVFPPDFPGTIEEAVLWDPDGRSRRVADVLVGLGIDLGGWQLQYAWDITPDGRTIIGTGRHNGQPESWIAYLGAPCRADFNHDGTLNSADFFAFLDAFFCTGPGCSSADFNADGVVNSQDFFDFVVPFFEGCG